MDGRMADGRMVADMADIADMADMHGRWQSKISLINTIAMFSTQKFLPSCAAFL